MGIDAQIAKVAKVSGVVQKSVRPRARRGPGQELGFSEVLRRPYLVMFLSVLYKLNCTDRKSVV